MAAASTILWHQPCLATDVALRLAECICSAPYSNLSISVGPPSSQADCCFTMSLTRGVPCTAALLIMRARSLIGKAPLHAFGDSDSIFEEQVAVLCCPQPHQALQFCRRTEASDASMLCRSPAGCV